MTEQQNSEAVRAWVEVSCASQRLPVRLSEVGVLGQVAGLLGARTRPAAGGDPSGPTPGSGTPDGREPGGVEAVVASSGGGDGDVVEDGGDDGVLAG